MYKIETKCGGRKGCALPPAEPLRQAQSSKKRLTNKNCYADENDIEHGILCVFYGDDSVFILYADGAGRAFVRVCTVS